MKREKIKERLSDEVFQEVLHIVDVLKKGGVVLYPTDTVWGIGCDASIADAVDKVNAIKKRADKQSLLLLLDNDSKLQRHVKEVPDAAWDIIDVSVSPTTIIYDEGYNLSDNVLASDGSIGIRICKDRFCQEIIKKLGKPLVSTSANMTGEPTPKTFKGITEDIKKQVDYIAKYRQYDKRPGKTSTIIKLGVSGDVKILRK